MRRALAATMTAAAVWLLIAAPALAALHEVSVGNYYYQDDATGARKLQVKEGDQIRFTIRQADYPPHSVNVDKLGIHSGDLLLFQTYTTPPLKTTGTFVLYCEAHRDQGHWTTLQVVPKATTPPPTAGATPSTTATQSTTSRASSTPRTRARAPTSTTTIGRTPTVAPAKEALVPSGVGVATDRRRASPEPNSVEALLGRDFSASGPWTRALYLALLAGIPIAVATGLALRRELARGAQGSDGAPTRILPAAVFSVGRAQQEGEVPSTDGPAAPRPRKTTSGARVHASSSPRRKTQSARRKPSSRTGRTNRSKR